MKIAKVKLTLPAVSVRRSTGDSDEYQAKGSFALFLRADLAMSEGVERIEVSRREWWIHRKCKENPLYDYYPHHSE